MLSRSRIPLKTLASLCRSLGTMLHSGVDIKEAFDLVARRTGDRLCRQILTEIREAIQSGREISESMRDYGDYFPEMVINMVAMAEQTGQLPEVLLHLGEHYENNLELRRTFLRSIAWPVFQLVAAILVIALLILVLGVIADVQGGEALDVLGLGLAGPSGAVTWLVCNFGTIAALYVIFQVINRSLRGKQVLDPLLMKIPVLGKCMQDFAIARFSWAYYLTQQTGMPIRRSLELSLRATSNGAYIAAIPQVCDMVQGGEELSTALAATGLFPIEYLHVVRVGETAGTVPES
ncbi:MAG: type II secretion system F family protein, partial [Planctomycetes bacterium]|nr:type II secretion system F family protein [Planctomycetota bacterium]